MEYSFNVRVGKFCTHLKFMENYNILPRKKTFFFLNKVGSLLNV